MVPVSRTLQDAGHEVAFATESRFSARVERAGFGAFPAGIGPGLAFHRTPALPGVTVPGPDGAWRFGAQMFAGVAAPAQAPAPGVVIRAWGPRLVISELTDFA